MLLYTNYTTTKYRDISQIYKSYMGFLKGQGTVLNNVMISDE